MGKRIRCMILAAVFTSLAGPFFLSAQTDKGRTFAFLVACGDYDKTHLKPVPFTVPEMKAFRDVLLQSGVADKHIVFLHDEARPVRMLPTRANIVEQFKLLIERLRPDDSVIVALSGHGIQFKNDKFGYFCPLDARIGADTKHTLLPMEGDEGLLKLLEQGKASRKLLIVNACRNNPTSSLNLAAKELDFSAEYNEEVPKGTVMLLACKQNQFSWFYPETEKRVERRNRSLFMYHLTEAWKGSYAKGKKVTVDHVLAEVSDRVEADAVADFNQNQMPIVKRKFDGSWDLGGGAATSGGSYDLTGGYRFCHFGPNDTVWALVTVTDEAKKRFQGWVVDARTGQKIAGPLTHQSFVEHAAFSPDGTRVVTASADKTAVVWDARTGQKVAGPLTHQYWVHHSAFSPDGTHVVTASADETAMIWDARTGQKIAGPLTHQGSVRHAAFSPDGTRLLTASSDKTARIWDARTGQKIAGPLTHQDSVHHAAFSPDGTRVVTASHDSTALVWDARTGEKIAGPLTHQSLIDHAGFSPDGTRLAIAAAFDKTAMIWDARTGQKVAGPLTHQNWVHHAAFSPDGTRVVTASFDKTAVVWDARTGEKIAGPLTHQDLVTRAAFSPDGTRVVTVSYDTVVLWDARTGEKLGSATVPK